MNWNKLTNRANILLAVSLLFSFVFQFSFFYLIAEIFLKHVTYKFNPGNIFSIEYTADWPNVEEFITPTIVLIAILLLAKLFHYAKKKSSSTASKVLEGDDRLPILFLRSFSSDAKQFDFALNDVMTMAGPFICLGQPGEKLAPLGAAREYADPNVWQESVNEILNTAAIVIVLAGYTEGLKWELSQCKEKLNPMRLFIAIPDDERLYNEFRREIEAELGIRLPEIKWKWYLISADGLVGTVRFDQHWSGTFEPFRISINSLTSKKQLYYEHFDKRFKELNIKMKVNIIQYLANDTQLALYEWTCGLSFLSFVIWHTFFG